MKEATFLKPHFSNHYGSVVAASEGAEHGNERDRR
jgi:hypothetical protein